MIKKLIIPDDNKILEFRKKTGLNYIQASILINRGFSVNDISFLEENTNHLLSPTGMMNALDAAKKIVENIKNGSKIINYSDGNDTDGAMSAVIFSKMMDQMGSSNHEIYVNKREEGFGMNVNGIKNIVDKWPETKLIVSSDNGIVAYEAIEYAQSLGIEVIVTDHHQPSNDGILPNCICVNPHIEQDTYEFKELCGTAVLWKVLSIAYHLMGITLKEAMELLDIVAIATVADVVPLIGENRIIVKEGLKMMNNDCRKHWKSIRERICSYSGNKTIITSKDIGWNIGPSINASSRISGEIMPSIKLFLSNNDDEIKDLANLLNSFNQERKTLTNDQLKGAITLAQEIDTDSAIIVYHEEMSLGLIGLIAGRLKDRYYKPTICFGKAEDGTLRGSGRSIEGIDIKEVLDKIQENNNILLQYGGHASACGLTIEEKNLEQFIICFNEICDKYPPETSVKNIYIDAVLKDGELNKSIFDSVSSLEPFGASFSEPIILIKDVKIQGKEIFGKLNQHLKIICDGFEIVSWNAIEPLEDHLDEIFAASEVSAFGTLSIDNNLNLIVEPTDMKFK